MVQCSFCGLERTARDSMMGPGVVICGECAKLALKTIASKRSRRPSPPGVMDDNCPLCGAGLAEAVHQRCAARFAHFLRTGDRAELEAMYGKVLGDQFEDMRSARLNGAPTTDAVEAADLAMAYVEMGEEADALVLGGIALALAPSNREVYANIVRNFVLRRRRGAALAHALSDLG